MTRPRAFLITAFTLGLLVVAAASPVRASATECGTVPGGIALYDVAVKNTSCAAGRKVGKQWLRRVVAGDCSRLNCRSRGYRCRAKRPAQIHYDVNCRKGSRRVSWTISVN